MSGSEDDESDRTDLRVQEDSRIPHTVTVVKTEHGFGFNVRGQVAEGGQLKSIAGQLYAPMQYISAVMADGPAQKAGLHVGDRIVEVNGQPVEGADHQTVVQMIRQSGKQVTLAVITVTEEEARRLEPDTSNNQTPGVEYYERRSVPVSIPESEKLTENGKEYVVYCIHMAGKKVASHRYREFDALNTNLKRQFSDFIFPKLPGKWPFTLNDVQIDGRRRGLEDYLDKICSAKVIFDSDLVQDFLSLKNVAQNSDATATPSSSVSAPITDKVKITVQLPDESPKTLTLPETSRTPDLLDAVLNEMNIHRKWYKYFGIFTVTEDGFLKKLTETDFPYQICQSMREHLAVGESCLFLRKWLFSVAHEAELLQDDSIIELIFQQAVSDIAKGSIEAGSEDSALRMLKAKGKQREFVDLAQTLPGYNSIEFPHCKCDARKTGHIILLLGSSGLSLKACSEDGVKEKQEHSFTWSMVTKYEADIEEQAFTFQCVREGKEPRWIRVYSPHYLYIEKCVDRIKEEQSWKKTSVGAAGPGHRDDDDDDL